MEILHGGRPNQIARTGNLVHRPSGPWSKSVHALLNHLHTVGFSAAPHPLGFDETGNEILTFLQGDVCNYPLSAAASSLTALESSAKLLRAYHDATVTFLQTHPAGQTWMFPARSPAEVICHGDFAPYNVVLDGDQAIGLIDFDTAHPGPRAWDLAYALYRWGPLSNAPDLVSFGDLDNRIARARRFCEVYGLAPADRAVLVDGVSARLQALADHIVTEAAQGNQAFQANMADGHHLLYLADKAYIQANRVPIAHGLVHDR